MDKYKIVLADDHALFIRGIHRLLSEKKDIEVIGEAKNGAELLELLKTVRPNMILLDISMPKVNGIEAVRKIKKLYPEIKVLILSMHKSREYLNSTISAGADGYILKEDSDMDLFSAIDTVRKGGSYLNVNLAVDLTKELNKSSNSNRYSFDSQINLSKREKEILKMIAEGNSNKGVSDILCISIRTVENHRSNIMKKLNTNKIADLVRYAYNEKIIELDSV